MNNEEDGQLTSRYSYQDFLELLSTYEGELQARDVIIDCLHKKQQLTSNSNHPSNSTTNALESLVRDSTYIDSSSLQSVNRCCSSCSNNLLSTAKFILSQREADIKIEKCLNLLKQRHSKYMEELAEKHKHILGIAKGEDGYIKELEVERDHLFGQVFNFWDFFWLILNFLERLNSGDKSCFDQIHILGVF
uniref:Cortactin-binding protein-2 N-terminal domain-containing protein n=1 Tax=Meloidogyne incognita TaxID=6306 RepID=A0A914LD80_MELIC